MELRDEETKQLFRDVKNEEEEQLWENVKKDLRQLYGKVVKYPLISLFFIIAVLLLIAFPHWQVSGINNSTVEAAQENQNRATLAQIFGGVAIGISLYYTWRKIAIAEKDLHVTQENLIVAQDNLKVTQENLKVTHEIAQESLKISQEGQINERFTRGIDQLGNEKMEIRLGGIYALEGIGKISEEYYWPIVEILTAYVRKNSCVETVKNKQATLLVMDTQVNESTKREASEIRKVSLDIQAVLTVLGRRQKSFGKGESEHLDLRATCLEEADFKGAHLEKAILSDAHLEKAILSDAHLEKAILSDAHLEKAILSDAHLEKAILSNAHLEEADFKGAHLEEADFEGAHLEKAILSDAHLEGANLRRAHLERADFEGAHLEGANLHNAYLEGAIFWDAHLEGAVLRNVLLEMPLVWGVHLEGADLEEVNLIRVHLEEEISYLERDENLTIDHVIDQLSTVKTLLNAKLDDKLLIPLKEKYPALFDKPDYL